MSAAVPPAADPPPLPKSVATVSLSGTLPEKLDAAATMGFDGVEIFENDLLTFGGSPAEVRDIAAGLGLAITIFQPFRDFEAAPDALRARNLDRAERKFDVMEALGTDLVLVCSNVQPSAIDDPARAAADLSAMAERAARRGLRVGYEALAWGRHVNRWSQAWDVVRRAAHPALGLIVDSFHTLSINDDVTGLADVPGEKLFFVQLADAPRLSLDVLSWSRHFRCFPGQGDLPVATFLRAALATGYRGPLSLEVFNDDFRSAPARLTALDGLRSLRLVEDEARAAPLLPAAPVLDGVDFLEFAVDEAAGTALAEHLRRLGFRRVGRHRSKSVELFRQGGINLVLNAEPDSAASEHFELHGPSVCATGLRVDDAGRTVARAAALLAPEWPAPIGEGPGRIPALRGPDGTLLHLLPPRAAGPSIYDEEFPPVADQGAPGDGATGRGTPRAGAGGSAPDGGGVAGQGAFAGCGLLAIDHVAQALPHGQMNSYVLFWRGVLGLLPQPELDLPDPYGLTRSRAMVSPERSVRLPLNVSESGRTATGRLVSAFGAAVHHVAFRTDDIVASVEAMLALGAEFLPIPPNYYDDLAARHGLDDARLAELQRLNLLYDRDEGGEFVQAYGRTFADRFFFEVVQRTDYEGFGAVNAAVRMAAQAPGMSAQVIASF